MNTTEKLLLGLGITGGLYLLLSGRASGLPPITVPGRAEGRIMEDYGPLMWSAGLTHRVDPAILAAVMYQESKGDPNARGSVGEVGLMQILPSTGAGECRLNEAALWQPEANIGCAARYLRRLLDVPRLKGSIAAALAAYNGGLSRIYLDASNGDKITGPNSAKAYSYNVMVKVPEFRDAFMRIPQYTVSYPVLFRWSDFQLDLKQTFNGVLGGCLRCPR